MKRWMWRLKIQSHKRQQRHHLPGLNRCKDGAQKTGYSTWGNSKRSRERCSILRCSKAWLLVGLKKAGGDQWCFIVLLSFSYSVPHEACAHTFYVLGGLVNVLLRNALKDAVSLEGVGRRVGGRYFGNTSAIAHIFKRYLRTSDVS